MVNVNLIPQAVLVSQSRRWRIQRWCVSTLIAVCALLVALGVHRLQLRKVEDLRNELTSVQQNVAHVRAALKDVADQADRIGRQIERAKAIRSKRSWSSLVALIDHALPKGCWLATLATDPHSPTGRRTVARKPPGAADPDAPVGPIIIEAPRRIKIEGHAPSDAEPHAFVAALKQTGVFSKVVLHRSQRQPLLDRHFFFFETVCEW